MEMPNQVPVMVLRGATLFPGAVLPLFIFEPRYRRMLSDVLEGPRVFAVAMQKPGLRKEMPMEVAGLGLVRASVRNKDGTSNLALQGIARIRLGETLRLRPYRVAQFDWMRAAEPDGQRLPKLVSHLLDLVTKRLEQGLPMPYAMVREFTSSGKLPTQGVQSGATAAAVREGFGDLQRQGNFGVLADLVACTMIPSARVRQSILETLNVELRLEKVVRCMRAEIRKHEKEQSE